ncbi:MAG: hypothetical protein ABIB71_08620 [Candidatus Woesearchaeota archaeon]
MYGKISQSKAKFGRRAFMGVCLGGLAGAAVAYTPKKLAYKTADAGEISEFYPSAVSRISKWLPSVDGAYRDAIMAEKIEGYVAPMLEERLGRKPNIAVVYGMWHAPLMDFIQNADERKRFLQKAHDLGVLKKLYTEDIDVVSEMNFSKDYMDCSVKSTTHNVFK